MGHIHAGELSPGSRLWPLFEALKTRRLTTRQITDEFRLCSASTEIAALRVEAPKHGWRVPLKPEYLGLTEDGRKVFRYCMERINHQDTKFTKPENLQGSDRPESKPGAPGALVVNSSPAEQLCLVEDVDGRDA
jgi:hypothetical protein